MTSFYKAVQKLSSFDLLRIRVPFQLERFRQGHTEKILPLVEKEEREIVFLPSFQSTRLSHSPRLGLELLSQISPRFLKTLQENFAPKYFVSKSCSGHCLLLCTFICLFNVDSFYHFRLHMSRMLAKYIYQHIICLLLYSQWVINLIVSISSFVFPR